MKDVKDTIIQILNVDEETFNKCQRELNDINGWYCWNPARGGLSIIINEKGEKLVANSSISFDRHYREFLSGMRN